MHAGVAQQVWYEEWRRSYVPLAAALGLGETVYTYSRVSKKAAQGVRIMGLMRPLKAS